MELKLYFSIINNKSFEVLIVLYGIETKPTSVRAGENCVLIVLYGIETPSWDTDTLFPVLS